MPDVVIHFAVGQQTGALLSPDIRDNLREAPFTFGLYGPDPWFMHKPWQHGYGRGRTMHTRKTGLFLRALADEARVYRDTEQGELLFSYLAGFICHYTMDAAAHPYIIWKTSILDTRTQAHRAMEHTLDNLEMERNGDLKGRHPVTENYLPKLKLPPEMKNGVDRAYLRVYGWKNAWRSANRCFGRFWRMYRLMEKPGGLCARLAKHPGKDLFKGFSYTESFYNGEDVENLSHEEWHAAYNPDTVLRTDFSDMREEAAKKAEEALERAQ